MPARTDSWSVRGLKERCELLRTDLEASRLATPEELAAYWPGGANNTAEPGRGQWIFCYANYVRFRGRSEYRESVAAQGEAIALRLLAAAPVVIATEGLPEGAPQPLAVHRKSAWALGHLAAHDLAIAHLDAHLQALRGSLAKGDVQLATAIQHARAEELALCVWAVTHPGPGLPWEPTQEPPPAPDWVRALDPFVTLRVQQTQQRANGTDLVAMKPLLAPDPDATGRGGTLFAGLFAGIAAELGFTPEDVIRSRPLLTLLAQGQLRASAIREAQAAAKEKADRDRPVTPRRRR